jgi:hypothetical protein
MATRWFFDYAMSEKALRLKRAFNRLFIDIEKQWYNRESVFILAAKNPFV